MSRQLRYIDKVLMGISVLILLFSPVAFMLNYETQLAISAGLLLLTGIPHGAVDHLVFFKVVKGNKGGIKWKSIVRFVSIYVLCFIVFLGFWFISPLLTLIIFLLVSAYHFGESQLYYLNKEKMRIWPFLYYLWGQIILTVFIIKHRIFAESLLSSLSSYEFNIPECWLYNILIVTSFVFLISMIYLVKSGNIKVRNLLNEILILGVISLVFICLPPLLAFMVYFGLWHSFKVIFSEFVILKKKAIVKNGFQFIKAILPFSLLALIGITVFLLVNSFLDLGINPIMLIIVAISAMTLPHALIMHGMYKNTL